MDNRYKKQYSELDVEEKLQVLSDHIGDIYFALEKIPLDVSDMAWHKHGALRPDMNEAAHRAIALANRLFSMTGHVKRAN